MHPSIVLLSGGQDSTTVLFFAKEISKEVKAITIEYGQLHSKEISAAEKVATLADVPWELISIDFLKDVANSALVGDNSDEINNSHPNNPNLPASFVPGRNIMLLTMAAIYGYKNNHFHIWSGVCQTDYSGYPDCRDTTIKALELALTLGMEAPFSLFTPLMWHTKAETVLMARQLKGCMEALAYSHTCYKGEYPPCGKCPSCKLRAKGFEEAGFADPLIERYKNERVH